MLVINSYLRTSFLLLSLGHAVVEENVRTSAPLTDKDSCRPHVGEDERKRVSGTLELQEIHLLWTPPETVKRGTYDSCS